MGFCIRYQFETKDALESGYDTIVKEVYFVSPL